MARAGSTTARGYGRQDSGLDHKAERQRLAPHVDAGHAFCAERICVMPTRWIPPGTPWDLAHNEDRTGYLGPAHQRCNRAAAGRLTGQRRRQAKQDRARRSREWLP